MLLAVVALGLASSNPASELDGPTVNDAHVTPDGASVVVALAHGDDGVLLHLELATGKALRAIRLDAPAQAVAIDSEGQNVALLCEGREVLIGALEGTGDFRSFTLPQATVTRTAWPAFNWTIEFSPSGDRLLVAVPHRSVVLADTDGTIVEVLTGDCRIYLQRAHRWVPSDGRIVIARLDALEVRDGSTGKVLQSIPALGLIKSLAIHPTRPIVATGHHDGRIRFWSPGDAAVERGQSQRLVAQALQRSRRPGAHHPHRRRDEHDAGLRARVVSIERPTQDADVGQPRALPAGQRGVSHRHPRDPRSRLR